MEFSLNDFVIEYDELKKSTVYKVKNEVLRRISQSKFYEILKNAHPADIKLKE